MKFLIIIAFFFVGCSSIRDARLRREINKASHFTAEDLVAYARASIREDKKERGVFVEK